MIAVLIAGLCRPTKEYCLENINILKNCFNGLEIKTIMVDYNNESSKFILDNTAIDNVILIKRQTDEEINARFPDVKCRNAIKGWLPQANVWRIREKIKIGLDLINSTMPETTHICIARPCTRVSFIPSNFLDKQFVVSYTDQNIVDDRFSFGMKDAVMKMYDYADKDILKECANVDNNEGLVRLIGNRHSIEIVAGTFDSFIIRPDRL